MYDLVLKGGSVLDPSSGLDGPHDIAVKDGAIGLKIFKNLGMDTYWADSTRVRTDDPRLAPMRLAHAGGSLRRRHGRCRHRSLPIKG